MERALAEHLSHIPVFVRTFDGEVTYWSEGASELYGYSSDEAVGRISHELLQTIFPIPLAEIGACLLEKQRWGGLLRHRRADGAYVWVQAHWRLRGQDGARMVVETCTDVTHREVLSRELSHRVKNILAVVQGLAKFTFAEADRESVKRYEGRLRALSGANDLLVSHQWASAELKEVLCGVAKRFALQHRFDLDGPDVILSPSSVISYSLAFHELTTNAMKYGGLSNDKGRVEVRWTLQPEDRRLHLVWRERDGPPVTPPQRKGFGSRLIERAIATELGAPVILRFEPTGLVCEMGGRLDKQSLEGASAAHQPGYAAGPSAS